MPIQKAFISSHYLSLSIRFPGKTLFLLLGLGDREEGILLSSKNIPSLIRQRSHFLDFARKYLVGKKLRALVADPGSAYRAVTLVLEKNLSFERMQFYWKDRELYVEFSEVLESSFESILESTPGDFINRVHKITGTNPEGFFQKDQFNFNLTEMHKRTQSDIAKHIVELSDHYVESFHQGLIEKNKRQIQKKLKFEQRKLLNIQSDIQRFLKKDEVKAELINNALNLEEESLEVLGIKFKFDEGEPYYKRREKVFIKIKNLESVIQKLHERKLELELKIKNRGKNITHNAEGLGGFIHEEKEEYESIKLPVVNPHWICGDKVAKNYAAFSIVKSSSLNESLKNKNTQDSMKSKKSEYLEIQIPQLSGTALTVWVGLSSSGNDQIRALSSKKHWWFHVDGRTSCHVILRDENLPILFVEFLSKVASLLCHFSKETSTILPIVYTRIGDLKGVKGKSGLVTYKREKHISVQIDQEFIQKIKESVSGES